MPNLPIKQNLIKKLSNTQYNSRIHKHNSQLQLKTPKKNTYLPQMKLPSTIFQNHAMLLLKCWKSCFPF